MRRRAVLVLALCVVTLSSAGAASSATRLPGFRSPSGNIRCLLLPGGTLLCSIAHADYAARLQARCLAPAGGGVDWHGFTLGATGAGAVNCSGGILYRPETQRPSYVLLPYGRSWRRASFTCASRVTGVTCRNRKGHGLFVSRETWRGW